MAHFSWLAVPTVACKDKLTISPGCSVISNIQKSHFPLTCLLPMLFLTHYVKNVFIFLTFKEKILNLQNLLFQPITIAATHLYYSFVFFSFYNQSLACSGGRESLPSSFIRKRQALKKLLLDILYEEVKR